MPRKFYKHKLLLDEYIPPRQFFIRLNAHFDVKHIDHDLHQAGLADSEVFELAVSQGRMILTKNVKDFRALLRDDSPGVIGIPETWSNERVDTKLTALLMKNGQNYFRGRYRSLAVEDEARHAT